MDLDRDLKAISWLERELEGGKKFGNKLKCSICEKFQLKIMSRRNLAIVGFSVLIGMN